jgi:mannosyltransferase
MSPDVAPALHVVHLDDIIYSLQVIGGISTYWSRLGEALTARGRVEVRRTGGSRFSRFVRVNSLGPVFHSSYFRVPASRSTRCVVTVHDLAFERRVVKTRTQFLSRLLRERAVRRADAIVCVSEFTKRELLEVYPYLRGHRRIAVIPHGCGGVDDATCRPSSGNGEERGPYAMFVGGRAGYKNFDLALQGFAASRFGQEADLLCCGAPLTRQERERVRQLGLESRVRLRTGVDSEGLRDFYDAATMLLYPSRYEGFGLPVLEAMVRGCPVIGLRGSAVSEVAGSAGVLLDSADALALADAIDSVAEPTRRTHVAELGVRHAAQFTWTASAEAHEALYLELAQ